jgi:hypothetical protein
MALKGEKPSGNLKKFLDAGKNDSRVLKAVERYVLTKPVDNSRSSTVLHPSAMVKDDWCHRSSYFQLLGFPPPPSKYKASLSQKRVFQLGHDIHSGWQNIFKEMGNLWGKWLCNECGQYFMGKPEDHDPKIDVKYFDYQEVPLVYEPLRIAGHADGILVGLGEPLMLEIKSIGAGTFRFEAPSMMAKYDGNLDKMWDNLTAPFMTHIMQAGLYMKLAELANLEYQPKESVFIYENKANQQSKEFVVAKSDFGLTHILDAAAMIVKSVEDKTPPSCNIDANNGCYQCKGYENA